jgi:hypothetical protein
VTCCVACLCDRRKAIILATDTMVEFGGFTFSEADIGKALELPYGWWALLAGNLSAAERIVERLRISMGKGLLSLEDACKTLEECYQAERLAQAEALYLSPIGWTAKRFSKAGPKRMGEQAFYQLFAQMSAYQIPGGAEIILAGFDDQGIGQLVTIGVGDVPFAQIDNMPGFTAIGSGRVGSTWWLAFRDMSYQRPLREALCYAIEAKYHGELAPGVGCVTELRILRHGEEPITLSDDRIDSIIDAVVDRIGPHELKHPRLFEVLNSIPELNGIEALDISKIKKPKIKLPLAKKKAKDAEEPAAPFTTPVSGALTQSSNG